jgi:hypothetical protein
MLVLILLLLGSLIFMGCDAAESLLCGNHDDSDCDAGEHWDQDACECVPDDTSDGDEPDGDEPDGDEPDGDVTDGDEPDGDLVDGDEPDGDLVDGDEPDGDVVDGDEPDGDVVDGDEPDGDVVDGDEPDGDVEPAIDEYLVAIWHGTNTADFHGNKFRVVTLSDSGVWGDSDELLESYELISSATFNDDGSLLAMGHEGGELVVYEVAGSALGDASFDANVDVYLTEMNFYDNDQLLLTDGTGEMWDGGIKWLDLAMETPVVDESFVSVHVPSGLALSPERDWAVVFGGEIVDDTNDMAAIPLSSAGFGEATFFDHWADSTHMYGSAFSPDGAYVAAGNYSAFASDADKVQLFGFDAGDVTALDDVEVYTPSDSAFSDDSSTLYVSAFEDNKVEVYSITDDELTPIQTVTGLPLADDIVPIRRGPLANHILVGILSDIVLFEVDEDGTLTEVSRVSLGDGTEAIISGFAVGTSY